MREVNDRIDDWVEAHREEILWFLQQLVQIPSENKPPIGYELECQRWLRARFEAAGGEVDFYPLTEVEGLTEHPAYLRGRLYHDRPNVHLRYRGSGGGRSLLFSSHVDTVPREPEPWSCAEPFEGKVIEGRLYGRGAYDMKGGLAASFLAARCVRDLQVPLEGDVLVESVVDEEHGGSNGTLAARLRGHNADVALVPEPSNLFVYPAHRGGKWYRIVVEGSGGRSFAGERVFNPTLSMARLIGLIEQFERHRNEHLKPPPFYEEDPNLPVSIMRLHSEGDRYAVEPGRPENFHLNVLTASPTACTAHVWVEVREGTTEEELDRMFLGYLSERWESFPDLKASPPQFHKEIRFLPGSSALPDHPFLRTIESAYRSIPGAECRLRGAPFACDAYIFNIHWNIPAYIIGPRGGNAHAPDEFVELESLYLLIRLYARLIISWCS